MQALFIYTVQTKLGLKAGIALFLSICLLAGSLQCTGTADLYSTPCRADRGDNQVPRVHPAAARQRGVGRAGQDRVPGQDVRGVRADLRPGGLRHLPAHGGAGLPSGQGEVRLGCCSAELVLTQSDCCSSASLSFTSTVELSRHDILEGKQCGELSRAGQRSWTT